MCTSTYHNVSPPPPLLLLLLGQVRIEQTLDLQPLSATTPLTENLPQVDVVVAVNRSPLLVPDDIANR